MSKIDQDLAAALKTAKKAKPKTMYFALVEKKPGEGTLIVSKNAIPAKAITDAQREIGGGKIYKGRCGGDPATGDLVFETARDAPSEKTLTAVIRRDAGLVLKVEARTAADVKDDDDPTAPPAPKPKSPLLDAIVDTVAKDEVMQRLGDLAKSDNYKTLMSVGGPVAEDLKKRIEGVKALIAKKDYRAASEMLDELKRFVDMAIQPA